MIVYLYLVLYLDREDKESTFFIIYLYLDLSLYRERQGKRRLTLI